MAKRIFSLRPMRSLILAALLVFVLVPLAYGTTYYVDFGGGSDSNIGTSAGAPFQRAPGDYSFGGSTRLKPGDTVIFRKGVTYYGMINTQSDSVAYTVGNWGSGDAVFDGSGQDACFQVNHSSITIDGGADKNMALTGPTIKHAAIWNFAGSPLSGSTFISLKIHDVGSPSSVEGIGIKIGGNSNAYTNYNVSWNNITNCYSAGIKISGNGTSKLDIHHNVLEGNGQLPGERCQVNLSSNDGAGVQNVYFHENTLKNGGRLANGINCNNANNYIYNNFISGNPGYGISLNPNYNTNYNGVTQVYNNYIGNNTGDYGIAVGSSDSSRPVRVYNNILANNGAYEVNLMGGAANNEFYNNTIYHTNAGHGIRVQGGANSNVFQNNIIWVRDGYTVYDSTGTLIENYNNLYREDGGANLVWANNSYATVSAYTSASGQGRNSLSINPQFSDASSFHLSSSSPCLNVGTNLSSIFATDRDGAARPNNQSWDMGPYQEGGGTPPPSQPPAQPTTPETPPTPATDTTFSIRAGATADIRANDGTSYSADKNFSGGSTAIFDPGVKGTSDPYLYRSERYGNFSYTIPLSNGNYSLTLKFAEMYWTSPGQRVFTVNAQGIPILANLDIVAKAGAKTAYDATAPVTVTNGVLKIDFISQVDNAKVSAIFVRPAGTGQTPTGPSAYFDTLQKLYIAYYQRPADPGGLLYWAQQLAAVKGNLNSIILNFATSAESRSLYGTIDRGNISSVINAIYRSLFNRDAEAAGLAYWVQVFSSGQCTAASIMLNVLNGAQGQDLLSVNNKLAAANLFTRTIDPDLDGANLQVTYSGQTDIMKARDFLSSVTYQSATVPSQDAMTAFIKNSIADQGDPILSR